MFRKKNRRGSIVERPSSAGDFHQYGPNNSSPGSFFANESAPEAAKKVTFQKLERRSSISGLITSKIGGTWHGSREVLKSKVTKAIKHVTGDSSDEEAKLPTLERLTYLSVNGANLDIDWSQLSKVEFFAEGGNTWLYSALFHGKQVIIKMIKPLCRNKVIAVKDLETELQIHAQLSHENIVELLGAGLNSKGQRFIILEILHGGSLMSKIAPDGGGFKAPRKFYGNEGNWREELKHARSLADALNYCHSKAIPGSMILHRDLKPDNIVFTEDGLLKLIDFGLAKIVTSSTLWTKESYELSGKTGSYRFMAPEVACELPYNHTADVYSFGQSDLLFLFFFSPRPMKFYGHLF